MDHYNRIQAAIDFMELHLQEDLRIEQIARSACFSAFHFQRLFQAISGFSVQTYIRRRRLSEAAIVLKSTDRNILDVALDYQYSSQEAFTRAFDSCFGVTPAKYRASGQQLAYQLKINFIDYRNQAKGDLQMNKPRITTLATVDIVGYEYITNLQQEAYFHDIPGFYHHFGEQQYYLHIPHQAAPGMAYGVSCRFQDNGQFSFIVGEAVYPSDDVLTKDLIRYSLPKGLYAEFKVHGHADEVQNTRRFIYGTWLPNSNYERLEGPDFEITDVGHSRYPDQMKMSIYIPIKQSV
ncbi:effector binding domain-containing protein [Paenibacillus sp. ACRRX]|uniref:AraC family transcriptional regulator n=1 Tax=unclassified Paenibacillus TaxID=185978 RepID=UPI001EF497AA|nr:MULTISPECIES: effector binding domain-containing protein [unclassified Paenibacillus]MCG7407205.1 effector binding domain-containing protein [Paenibacillus sp. ACRRX]MDK8180425.1 effector binding domain-containing protein [Paenibacillus sp. UMB4589-SE434]